MTKVRISERKNKFICVFPNVSILERSSEIRISERKKQVLLFGFLVVWLFGWVFCCFFACITVSLPLRNKNIHYETRDSGHFDHSLQFIR